MEILGYDDTLKLHSSARFCYLWCQLGQYLLHISKPQEKRSLSFLVLIQHLPQRWFCLGLPGAAGASMILCMCMLITLILPSAS